MNKTHHPRLHLVVAFAVLGGLALPVAWAAEPPTTVTASTGEHGAAVAANHGAAPVELDTGEAIERKCVTDDGDILGMCGSHPGVLPACELSWSRACTDAGGLEVDCAGALCDQDMVECKDDSAVLHACDEAFITGCTNAKSEGGLGGTWGCTSSTGCPGSSCNCSEGICWEPGEF